MANQAAKPPVSPASMAAPPAAAVSSVAGVPAKKSAAIYVVLVLLVVMVVGVAVGLELFRSKMEEMQQGQGGETRLGIATGSTGGSRELRSRELKPKEVPVVAAAPVDDDDLAGLGKKKKPPPPKALLPVEKAWRAVKGDYDKLQGRNESTAKKYRMKMLTLEDRKDSVAEATFMKEATALEEALKEELAKPENQ